MGMMRLELDHLQVHLFGIPVLRGISLQIAEGETCGIVGRNGAGKTTTMRSIMGLCEIQEGRILIDGENVTGMKGHERAAMGVGYVPEDRRLIPGLTAEENVLLPAWVNRVDEARSRLARLYEVIPEAADFADRPAMALSGGQQKMVALARAMMTGHRLLLLDEPFEGLAGALAHRVATAVREMQAQEGIAVLVAESDLKLAKLLAERVVTLERGELVDDRESAEPQPERAP
jgi:branched-chain amino acid transport system ATP-binding protein